VSRPRGQCVYVACCGLRPRFCLPEAYFSVGIRHLEEREVQLTEFTAHFELVISMHDRQVLNHVPFVVVFLGRQPVVRADLAVTAKVDLRSAPVQRYGWIVAADPELFVYIRVGISLRTRGNQAAESHARFVYHRGRERMGPAQHGVAAKILLAGTLEIAAVQRALEGRNTALSCVCPTDGAENAVVVVVTPIDAAIPLVCIQRSRS